MTWTSIAKPSGPDYGGSLFSSTYLPFLATNYPFLKTYGGKPSFTLRQWDDSEIQWDEPGITWDGGGYTRIDKPSGPTYTNIAKPS